MLDVRTPAGWASMALCGKIPLTTTIAEQRVQTNSRNGEMIFDFLLVNCVATLGGQGQGLVFRLFLRLGGAISALRASTPVYTPAQHPLGFGI